MAETAVVEQEGSASAAAPVIEKVAPASDDQTLLGATDKPVEKEVVKEPTAEEKAVKVEQEAANKKLLETDDKDLKPEDLAKKQELVKAKQEADAAGNKVPEKYEFKLPEGQALDTGLLDKVTPVMKELGLTQVQAQKLVDVYAPYIKEQSAALVKQSQEESMKVFNQMKTEWKDQTNKLLGAEPAKELAYAAKFINKFGSPELRQMFNDTGVGNHPELVKLLVAAGKAISEDAMPRGKTTSEAKEGGIDTKTFYSHSTSPK